MRKFFFCPLKIFLQPGEKMNLPPRPQFWGLRKKKKKKSSLMNQHIFLRFFCVLFLWDVRKYIFCAVDGFAPHPFQAGLVSQIPRACVSSAGMGRCLLTFHRVCIVMPSHKAFFLRALGSMRGILRDVRLYNTQVPFCHGGGHSRGLFLLG